MRASNSNFALEIAAACDDGLRDRTLASRRARREHGRTPSHPLGGQPKTSICRQSQTVLLHRIRAAQVSVRFQRCCCRFSDTE